jgi:hypothetical protein
MERLMGTAQLGLEHAYLIEHNFIGGIDSIIANTVLVIKRIVAKRAEVVRHSSDQKYTNLEPNYHLYRFLRLFEDWCKIPTIS